MYTDASDYIPPTSENKKVSHYNIVSEIIYKYYLLNINKKTPIIF